jgi:hypothetical protein
MTGADYRDMARDVRDLIPLLLHPKAVADLRELADRYERLAHYLCHSDREAAKRPADIGRWPNTVARDQDSATTLT